jgi:predicted ATP-grasp superfamily ATP-dependent carboligase
VKDESRRPDGAAAASRDAEGTGNDGNDPAVVVPATGAPSSTAVLRSLGGSDVRTVAVSEAETPSAFWSRYCDEAVSVPDPSEHLTGYRDALLSLARRDAVRAITPMREADVYTLAKHRDAFADHLEPLWPTLEQLEVVHDRDLLLAAAERADVPVPETRRLDEIDDWGARRIVKARYAILTSDYVDSMPADRCEHPPKTIYLEPGREPDVESIVDAMGHVPIAQEYLAGTEYCLRAFCRNGEPVATSQKRLGRGYKYPRGPSIYHEAVDIPRLVEVGLALLAELEWDGVASVGFIRDESGAFKLLEVNPRFWSNLSMDVYSGVDYPEYFWRLANGEPVDGTPDYQPGVASHLLRGEAAHLYSVLFEDYPFVERPSIGGTVWDIAMSLYEHPRFDLLTRDDPGPFVRDLLNAVESTPPVSLPGSTDAADAADDSADPARSDGDDSSSVKVPGEPLG